MSITYSLMLPTVSRFETLTRRNKLFVKPLGFYKNLVRLKLTNLKRYARNL